MKRERFLFPPAFLKLLSDVELFDDRTIAIDIDLNQVVEQITSVTYHLKQTAAGMMIIRVRLQMLGKLIDPSSQDCDLDFRRTGILLMQLVSLDNGILNVLLQHFFSHLSFRFVRPDRGIAR